MHTDWQMVAALVAALASCIGVATTIICVSFWSGKMIQQIADNRKMLEEHDATLVDHSQRLSGHDVDIATLKAWRDGYEAKAAELRDQSNG